MAKLALYWAIPELGTSLSELARRLNVRETAVRRMLDPNHDTRAVTIQAALEAAGKRVAAVSLTAGPQRTYSRYYLRMA